MLFNSFTFWLFFAAVFAVYCSLSHRWQNRFLLAASYFFYAWWDQAYPWSDIRHYRFVGLMFATSALDYFIGGRIAALQDRSARRRWLILSLVSNLGVLGFFKYFNFFVDSAQAAITALGFSVPPWHLAIILPVSISFYTFQSMAYTVDIYRDQVRPARSLRDYLLFISYFPHLVAGPINRPQSLLSQCENPRRMTWDNWTQGAALIVFGLFKKIAVADMLAPLADQAFSQPARCSAGTLLFGLYCFTFQIYADFSGYTDIARGLAKLMGFELMQNFNQPYFAANVTVFWRRWHISLSSWLRDYLYIPLGGSRHGAAKTYRNLFLTMFLGGLWHGANWTFAIWGALHGVYLAVHRLMLRSRKALDGPPQSGAGAHLVHLLKILATFHLVAFAWIFFRAGTTGGGSAATIGRALQYVAGLWPFGAAPANAVRFDSDAVAQAVAAVAALLILVDLPQYLKRDHCAVLRWRLPWRAAAFAALCLWLIMLRETENVRFIYFQF
ncbi:MAG: MBOAT family protein [Planctomycetota bacterium]|nr:MBOAT family protein [Planctomycetota bacterium]